MAAIAQARLIMTGGPSRFDFTHLRMPLAKGEFHLPIELKASNNLGLSIRLLWQNKRKIAAESPKRPGANPYPLHRIPRLSD
jgi:hypothetical protein